MRSHGSVSTRVTSVKTVPAPTLPCGSKPLHPCLHSHGSASDAPARASGPFILPFLSHGRAERMPAGCHRRAPRTPEHTEARALHTSCACEHIRERMPQAAGRGLWVMAAGRVSGSFARGACATRIRGPPQVSWPELVRSLPHLLASSRAIRTIVLRAFDLRRLCPRVAMPDRSGSMTPQTSGLGSLPQPERLKQVLWSERRGGIFGAGCR